MSKKRRKQAAPQNRSARKRPRGPDRPTDLLPARRPVAKRSPWRWVLYATLVLAYAAVMWFFVFPWVDKTFVNQPAL